MCTQQNVFHQIQSTLDYTRVETTCQKKEKSFQKGQKVKARQGHQKIWEIESHEPCKSAYNTYLNNIVDPETNENPEKLWSFIKSKKTDNTGVARLQAKNGITYSDSDMKVNTLNEQLVSVFNKDEDISTALDMGSSQHPAMHHIEVSQEGDFKLLNGLQVHKATGPDELPSKLLKERS